MLWLLLLAEALPLRLGDRAVTLASLRAQVLQARDEPSWPCPGSGKMLEVCAWYFDFVKEHTEPPVSLAGDLKGGTQEWHGPDAEIVEACEKNHNTVCALRHQLCEKQAAQCP